MQRDCDFELGACPCSLKCYRAAEAEAHGSNLVRVNHGLCPQRRVGQQGNFLSPRSLSQKASNVLRKTDDECCLVVSPQVSGK